MVFYFGGTRHILYYLENNSRTCKKALKKSNTCSIIYSRENRWRGTHMKDKEYYRGKINELVEKIENPAILMKIYTVVKTHYRILKEKEQED